jgi:hypothetical protein
MDLSERIEAFAQLGNYLKDSLTGEGGIADPELQSVAAEAQMVNPWFTPLFIYHALSETSRILDRSLLGELTGKYSPESFQPVNPLIVGTILAGNIPLVGFHDFLCVLLSGHNFKGKMSGKDDKLLPFLADKLQQFESRFTPSIHFEESYIGSIDAMIATGSDNSFRYFEYYFGRYPHIFRKNRNGIAILTGDESAEELAALADDIFLYFGMGCRNVAKLYVPENYSFDRFFGEMEKYSHVGNHNKYANNYQYQRSVFLMNSVKHLDNGFLLLRPDQAIPSPVGTLHYETYPELPSLVSGLQQQKESIQCIASRELSGIQTIGFGKTQNPELWDFADNMDTLKFLSNL